MGKKIRITEEDFARVFKEPLTERRNIGQQRAQTNEATQQQTQQQSQQNGAQQGQQVRAQQTAYKGNGQDENEATANGADRNRYSQLLSNPYIVKERGNLYRYLRQIKMDEQYISTLDGEVQGFIYEIARLGSLVLATIEGRTDGGAPGSGGASGSTSGVYGAYDPYYSGRGRGIMKGIEDLVIGAGDMADNGYNMMRQAGMTIPVFDGVWGNARRAYMDTKYKYMNQARQNLQRKREKEMMNNRKQAAKK